MMAGERNTGRSDPDGLGSKPVPNMIDLKRALERFRAQATTHRDPSSRPIVPVSLVLRGSGTIFIVALTVALHLPSSSSLPARDAAPLPAAAGVPTSGTYTNRLAPPSGAVYDRGSIRDLATCVARRHQVDEDLVLAVIEYESSFNPFAVSPKGAKGLMQLMPATAAYLGVTDPFDPLQNVDGGVRYLKELLERHDGKVGPALAAYRGIRVPDARMTDDPADPTD
jgi:soluble lytic murein transglycosylase-like protein